MVWRVPWHPMSRRSRQGPSPEPPRPRPKRGCTQPRYPKPGALPWN
jgi:hypothetical protein